MSTARLVLTVVQQQKDGVAYAVDFAALEKEQKQRTGLLCHVAYYHIPTQAAPATSSWIVF